MTRKKWTAQANVTSELIQIRLKRKWQIAFRRYVLGETLSQAYAGNFGLDVLSLRNWISIQFTGDMSWDNFSKTWQFDHLVPVSLFDFTAEEDLRMCWNFINIRPKAVNQTGEEAIGFQITSYFQLLSDRTGNPIAGAILQRLSQLGARDSSRQLQAIRFIESHQQHISDIGKLSPEELAAVNQGKPLADIMAEHAFLQKFG